MLNLYVIRHGETEWNTQKRMQGRLDSDLTDKGVNDALLLGERLKETDFKRVISSPSKRAMETANRVIGKRSISIETDERLMEIDLGHWQGKTESEIKGLFPTQFNCYWNQPVMYENPEGESFLDVKNRVADLLNNLEGIPSGNVLIVTHGIVIKILYLLCRNASVEEIWNPPFIHGTSLTIVKIHDDQKELLLEACMAHCR